MAVKGRGEYPDDWKAIATQVKEAAQWRCIRCGHPNERPGVNIECDDRCDASKHPGGLNDGRQRVLTVHHLTGHKNSTAWFLLLSLCQVCHLSVQGRVNPDQPYFLEHSTWMKPYVAGFYAMKYLGLQLTRAEVELRLDELLALERLA